MTACVGLAFLGACIAGGRFNGLHPGTANAGGAGMVALSVLLSLVLLAQALWLWRGHRAAEYCELLVEKWSGVRVRLKRHRSGRAGSAGGPADDEFGNATDAAARPVHPPASARGAPDDWTDLAAVEEAHGSPRHSHRPGHAPAAAALEGGTHTAGAATPAPASSGPHAADVGPHAGASGAAASAAAPAASTARARSAADKSTPAPTSARSRAAAGAADVVPRTATGSSRSTTKAALPEASDSGLVATSARGSSSSRRSRPPPGIAPLDTSAAVSTAHDR